MDSRKIVIRETATVAVGELLLCAATVGVFAALGYFNMNVLWGSLTGCLVMILNYFFMAVAVSLAADRAEQGDVETAKKMIQLSSTVRLVVMGVALVVAIKLGANVLALLLPMLYARPIVLVAEFFRKKENA
jgi:hypothetical protein